MLKTELTEHDLIRGHYRHPIFLHIYVSKEGSIFNNETKRFAASDRLKGYCYISSVSRPVHLLVLDTFEEVPPHLNDGRVLLGNHLNGKTIDNRLVNLEWTDHQGNANHAFSIGLRTDNIPVLVKDLRTGEISKYYGIHETGRQLGVSGANVHWYLKLENFGKVFSRFYHIIREGVDWPETPTTPIDPVLGEGFARAVYVEDYQKKVHVIFTSIGSAAGYLGVVGNTVRDKALRDKLNHALVKGMDGYICDEYGIWYLDTYRKIKEVSKEVVRYVADKQKRVRTVPAKMPIPVVVTDLATGMKEWLDNIDVFTTRLGVKRKTFQKYIYMNAGVWKGKYHVQYIRNEGPTE